jgi:hypothetical protein
MAEQQLDLPTYEEVLRMLAVKAGEGSVSAMVALGRVLRDTRESSAMDPEIKELLYG